MIGKKVLTLNKKSPSPQINYLLFAEIAIALIIGFPSLALAASNFSNQTLVKGNIIQQQLNSSSSSKQNSTFQISQATSSLFYNVSTPPNLRQSQQLQVIIDEVINLVENKGLPKSSLSITLINVNTGEISGYQQQQLRYPASVVKMFWLVALYSQLSTGRIQRDESLSADIYQMIQNSNNESASRILDRITNTESGARLEGEAYTNWLQKRQQVTTFFQAAGYKNINISQKTFPLPYLNLYKPGGRELQMRGNPNNPIRNKMRTYHAGRLLYEIFTGQAVSREASQQMAQLLTRDLRPQAGKNMTFDNIVMNPIQNFIGESLPPDTYLASKAGWTSTVRHEAAFISTKDQKTKYILVVFGEDPVYFSNKRIFPQISRLVFNRMSQIYNPK